MKTKKIQKPKPTFDMIGDYPPPLFVELRNWRLTEAKKRGIPAFRIMSDRILYALCELRPTSEEALLQVPGIGPRIAGQYGAEILKRTGAATPA